jgi:methylenetetrahydrofolate reductase (NADPH)
MKVIEALNQGKPTLSFEFFPPKTPEQEKRLFEVIARLKKFNPDYVSVTYGALGTTREKTFFWVKEIKEKFGIEPVAHLTCIAASKSNLLDQINALDKMGTENILALRGDPPEGIKKFIPPPDGFLFAKDLVAFIKQRAPHFCLGVAGYPEKHPESPGIEEDIARLKQKVDAGADYIVTQLFFDNNHYFNFVGRCRKAGIMAPIIPGIMPITSYKLLKKMTKICGATLPPRLLSELEQHRDSRNAILKIGIEQAVKQCAELRKSGTPGLHFFVMNQAGPITEILTLLNQP